MGEKRKFRYRDAGVDISAQDDAIGRMKSAVRSTFGPSVLSDVGNFGGLVALDVKSYKEPVLVASIDSVGTKLKIAFLTGINNTVGRDLVAHCVNDILAQGARPLFFMDCLSMGKLDPDVAKSVVEGIAEGCRQVGCALLGGETAELPDFYEQNEYDLVGTIVGIVEKEKIIDGSAIKKGDKIIGIASDGLHTNGYSLARKLLFEVAGFEIDDFVEELGTTLKEELLKPHRCYFKPLWGLLEEDRIKGIAHVTGGGLKDNIPRILPDGVAALVDTKSWDVPPIFSLLQRVGNVAWDEMFRTFNMGIGLGLLVSKSYVKDVLKVLEDNKEKAYIIGDIVDGDKETRFTC